MTKETLRYINWDGRQGVVVAGPYAGRLVRLRYPEHPASQVRLNCQILMDSGWVTVHTAPDEPNEHNLSAMDAIMLYMNRWFRGIPT